MVDSLSKALEQLQFMLGRPESGKGASGPADEGDVDMGDAVPSDEAPQAKKMKRFVAALKPSHAVEIKLVTLEPVVSKAGYFKVVDPLLPASAAALLRDTTVLEMGALFHKFVGEVWRLQFQQSKVGIGAQRTRRLDAGQARLRPHVQVARRWVAAVLGLPGLGVRSSARPGIGGGQAGPHPLGYQAAPRRTPDVWGGVEKACPWPDP